MKKTLSEIRNTVELTAHEYRENAAFSGSSSDCGAGALEKKLTFFIHGVFAGVEGITGVRLSSDDSASLLLEVPIEWEKFFIEEDPEYIEYQRLKKKFEK